MLLLLLFFISTKVAHVGIQSMSVVSLGSSSGSTLV